MASSIHWPAFSASDSPMDQLVRLSNYFGSDPDIVLGGGGNTSVKVGKVLHVKGSGHSLATMGAEGFVALDRAKLDAVLKCRFGAEVEVREEQYKQAILAARLEPARNQRPSVESVLHNLLASRFVVHTHPTAVNMLACCTRGPELAAAMFGPEVLWVPCSAPGLLLAKALAASLAKYVKRTGRKCPDAVIMQNHGLVICGQTPRQIKDRTEAVLGAIQRRLDAAPVADVFGPVRRVAPDAARAMVRAIGPALRGLLASSGQRLKIVAFDDSDTALSLAGGGEGRKVTDGGPLIPDHIVYCMSMPMWFVPRVGEAPPQTVARLRKALAEHRASFGAAPSIILAEGLGLFACGDDIGSAETARQVYLNAIQVLAGAKRLGGIEYMTAEHRRFIENWEVEAYRRGIAAAAAAGKGRAAGKVALVTGAAQGFGLEIAQDLAAQGACVALADVNEAGAAEAAKALCRRHGAGRAISLRVDVTDAASVAEAVGRVVAAYGGLDLLVSNAGVLKAGSVKDQPVGEFRFVTDVNYTGYFLCVQNAAPVMGLQHLARTDYLADVIQINSKSGLAGSNRNSAYAGSKFGGIGLTQSFALELIADGIKVNAICPGNFLDGPLWSDPKTGLFVQYLKAGKVPGAKTIADVRRAYEAKVPMGRGCTAADVMTAIYYVMEQKYETGQAVPVTGGQVMLS